MMTADTIFALATPPGKSGVAIIRVSGPMSKAVAGALGAGQDVAAGQVRYAAMHKPSGELIDKGLVLFFKAPHSFTGEDVLEFQLHGSMAVIREISNILADLPGMRPAEPGEFSRRAFLNGKMDLLEVEGLADLIAAETPRQKQQAQRQMAGGLSGYYADLRAQMVRALAMLEAYIDFPDEEIPESVLEGLAADIEGLKSAIGATLTSQKNGERLREGMRVVILGAPNAGKSSLLNTIAKKDAAIVSHKAGTTRDVIEVHMDIAGFPVILADTAGLRESGDDIEEEGIRRAISRAGDADLKLLVFDGQNPVLDAKTITLKEYNSLIIINKIDITDKGSLKLPFDNVITISAKTGEGLDKLLSALEQSVIRFFSSQEAPVITRQRHRSLLQAALGHLERFAPGAPLELSCENLRLAAQSVGKITGKIQVDELLDVIFKQFCIGK
jgi:tRNA modification GTPase